MSYQLLALGARLELCFDCGGPETPDTIRILLDVGKEPACRTIEETQRGRSSRPVVWPMTVSTAGLVDCFSEVSRWVLNRLHGRGGGPSEIILEGLFGELSAVAIERCDPGALAVAAPFHERARLYVYSGVMTRGTWFAQCARVCPGLMLASCLLSRTKADGPVLLAITRGERLNHVLDLALSLLLTAPNANAMSRLERVRFRRAPVSLDPWILLDATPRGARTDDIPRDGDSICWYRAMHSLVVSRWFRELDASAQERLGGFISKNAALLETEARSLEREVEGLVDEIADYAARSGGAVPVRQSNVDRVILDLLRWHFDVVCLTDLPLETPLAWAPFPKPPWPLRVRILRSFADLMEEGMEMEHCVASHVGQAHAGSLFVFSGHYIDERLTIAVERHQSGFRLFEMKRKRNQCPSTEASLAVQDWIARWR